ncbi:hypothetical protein [Euzebya sp.]|uniref:hypothetical protein n=1 Tax=Euzebya sp. TaxID=1971409 RepID=UPI0035120D3C
MSTACLASTAILLAEAVADLDGFDRDLTAVTFQRVQADVFAVVTDTVEQVTGRPARTLAAFLEDAGDILGTS